jgi:cytoskeletal protein CcmA (bactofilin family)
MATTAMIIGFNFALVPSIAQAEERTCRGTIGATTVHNLRVPQGGSCTLNGTTVKGTVKVERGATLIANGVRVIGNVQAENAARVVVRDGSRIGGSVQIVQGGAARVAQSTVNADILYDENRRML